MIFIYNICILLKLLYTQQFILSLKHNILFDELCAKHTNNCSWSSTSIKVITNLLNQFIIIKLNMII
jgi:hypothetical protein